MKTMKTHSTTWLLLGATALAVVVALIPLRLPIGAMYWDILIYFDAAQRLAMGQVPNVDFHAPVGPFGYVMVAGLFKLFPNGHPLFLTHWAMVPLTVPLLIWLTRSIESRTVALAVVVPFIIFQFLPFNTRSYFPFPGSDGFGIYNRQVCHLLYVLVVALFVSEGSLRKVVSVSLLMIALFFTKITGFLSGGVLCAVALFMGRVRLAEAVQVAVIFAVACAVAMLWRGMPLAYVEDIFELAAMNKGGLVARLFQSASLHFSIVAAGGAFALGLLYVRRPRTFEELRKHPALPVLAVLMAGVLFESQNTGSQGLVMLWPVVATALVETTVPLFVLILAATAVLPPVAAVVQSAARTWVGAVRQVAIEMPHIGRMGALTIRPEMHERIGVARQHILDNRKAYEDWARVDQLPDFIYYSQFDYQALHLVAIDAAVARLKEIEAASGARFDTLATFTFTNPFAAIMDRDAPRHMAIGADPERTVPPAGQAVGDALAETDLIMIPTCPMTSAIRDIGKIYMAAPGVGLSLHERKTLTPCYDVLVHPKWQNLF